MDFAAAFLEQNRAFGDVIGSADPSAPVPTCPGWNLDKLIRHVGRGDRWAAQIIGDRLDHYLDPRSVDGGKPPPDRKDAISWLHGGAQRLIDAVELTGPETPVWTFLGLRPANWWVRRRLHETAVHRADAELAVGHDFTLAAEIAADAISEWLERVAIQGGRDGQALPLDDGNTLHLHATDSGLDINGEWTIALCDDKVTWSHEHGKGTVALRGSAVDLLLAVLRRKPIADTAITLFGDETVWHHWLDRTPL
ncbi:MAG: maleylpyruvate isomerase family mycothiol-dependent enzyme [Mycobacterium sp.]|uniref:maleylpyruvate isomerase family mycothiol-dependent enzyme n=1 Tax=Mycobacterium sp. TaxID=1785 RepID=UPI003CC5896D